MMMGILGILKAGGAYLPLDPKYPKERLEWMVKDAKAVVVLATSDLEAEVREREQTENQLKRDRQLFTRGPVTVFRWSAEDGWPIEYVSKTVAQFGYDADELMENRTSYASLIHRTDLQHVEEAEFDSNEHGLVAQGIDYRLPRFTCHLVQTICDFP